MKNIKYNRIVCMLVSATFLLVAGTSIAKNTTEPLSDPEIEWVHTFESILNDRAYYVDQTVDGGYVFTGSTIVSPPGYTELLLVKTDRNGEESWRQNYPIFMSNLWGTVVHQTTDGGYIIVGTVGDTTYLWDVQVTKTDSNGGLIWQKNYGKADQWDKGSDILQTADGGYMILGSTASYGQGSTDLWLIKITADGTEQWNKAIGGTTLDYANSFAKTNDGYIIVGLTDAIDGIGDVWVVKTNENGDVIWQKTFGDATLGEEAMDVITDSDGYTVLGNMFDANWTEHIWLLHLTEQGTLTSDQLISGDGTLHGTSITKTSDNGYFITGSLSSIIDYAPDAYLVKLDAQGNTQWIKTLDLSNKLNDEAACGIQTKDGGYVAVGGTGDWFNHTSDTFIVKIKAGTNIVLDSVTGGFGVQALVKNLGSTEATDVTVSISITGGFFHHVNVSYTETISIPAGEDATVSCKPFLGLGPLDITVTVDDIASEYKGTQLFILTLVHS